MQQHADSTRYPKIVTLADHYWSAALKQPGIQQWVLQTLRAVPENLYFHYNLLHNKGCISITKFLYYQVADAIDKGRVTLKIVPSLAIKKFHAVYYPKINTIMLPVNITTMPGLLIHEATHAALDLRKRSLRKVQSESIAYIAQHMHKNLSGRPSRLRSGYHAAAHAVASRVLATNRRARMISLMDDDVMKLALEIEDGEYGRKASYQMTTADG